MAEQVCFFCGAPAGRGRGALDQVLACETCLKLICERCVIYDLNNLPYCERCYLARLNRGIFKNKK